MKKILLFVIIGFLLIVTVIGVGGKMYMDKKEEEKLAEKIEAERMSVKAFKNTFADIKSVEFEKSGYNGMTGTYRMFVQMTNHSDKHVQFSYSYSKENPEEIRGYMLENKKVQIKGETMNKVLVTYSNKVKDEI